jgi:hypothetical protein
VKIEKDETFKSLQSLLVVDSRVSKRSISPIVATLVRGPGDAKPLRLSTVSHSNKDGSTANNQYLSLCKVSNNIMQHKKFHTSLTQL